jgi:hypothetical protein
VRAQGRVSFPAGEVCNVVPSPVYERPVLAVASYKNPPPFSNSLIGHLFVPFPPDRALPDEVQQRLENNSFAGIPTIAVHETYPGHHRQLVAAHSQPSALRKTFRTSYFTEGWGLYAEHLMRERPDDGQRRPSPVIGLTQQHPRHTAHVVAMEMTDQHQVDADDPQPSARKLICVPSPQSNRIRCPSHRTSTLASQRFRQRHRPACPDDSGTSSTTTAHCPQSASLRRI